MPQPLTAEALETPKTRQGAKVLPLREEQPSRPAPKPPERPSPVTRSTIWPRYSTAGCTPGSPA